MKLIEDDVNEDLHEVCVNPHIHVSNQIREKVYDPARRPVHDQVHVQVTRQVTRQVWDHVELQLYEINRR
jgi:phage-related baseplate assembly protein